MSTKTIETILTRAMTDAEFADLLLANPELALAGYELTAEEMTNLKGMSRADFAHFQKVSPEKRRSFLAVPWVLGGAKDGDFKALGKNKGDPNPIEDTTNVSKRP